MKKIKRLIVHLSEEDVDEVLAQTDWVHYELEDLECVHDWKRIRTYELLTKTPVKVMTKWYDIPNGEEGDYYKVTNLSTSEVELKKEKVAETVTCERCGAEVIDGGRASY